MAQVVVVADSAGGSGADALHPVARLSRRVTRGGTVIHCESLRHQGVVLIGGGGDNTIACALYFFQDLSMVLKNGVMDQLTGVVQEGHRLSWLKETIPLELRMDRIQYGGLPISDE
ncbi:hypothetical protein E2562_030510 [Oryza meyeriana var. granulata]|uniref:Uncharacterized protein n=1 Tax=Oryza meyeriana var. granulata TaxID=110450 RepID=A0A6G1BNX9_9ORYZ|nr:hypothetical protein E2562_030510 [Oryza meyeriana var. granulata]